MRDWIAGAMTVLGTLLVLSGAAIIVLRAWSARPEAARTDVTDTTAAPATVPTSTAVTPAATAPAAMTPAERGASALFRLGPPDRLILWGTLLLVLAAIAAGAIGFELGASATAK
jgi:hypothetical protein